MLCCSTALYHPHCRIVLGVQSKVQTGLRLLKFNRSARPGSDASNSDCDFLGHLCGVVPDGKKKKPKSTNRKTAKQKKEAVAAKVKGKAKAKAQTTEKAAGHRGAGSREAQQPGDRNKGSGSGDGGDGQALVAFDADPLLTAPAPGRKRTAADKALESSRQLAAEAEQELAKLGAEKPDTLRESPLYNLKRRLTQKSGTRLSSVGFAGSGSSIRDRILPNGFHCARFCLCVALACIVEVTLTV